MSHWPQYTWIALTLVSLFLSIMRDGQVRLHRERAWLSLVLSVLVNALFYAGGFYDGLLR